MSFTQLAIGASAATIGAVLAITLLSAASADASRRRLRREFTVRYQELADETAPTQCRQA